MKESKIDIYIREWKTKGYPVDIPDDVPKELMRLRLAPSYKAICLAILNNDLHFKSLGFSAPTSEWYSVLKSIEIKERNTKKGLE